MDIKTINDMKQMERMEGKTRFFLDISDKANDNLKKVKEFLEDAEAKGAFLKDAAAYYMNSSDFNPEKYLGPGHVHVDK